MELAAQRCAERTWSAGLHGVAQFGYLDEIVVVATGEPIRLPRGFYLRVQLPFAVGLDRDLIHAPRRVLEDVLYISDCSSASLSQNRHSITYSSTARLSNGAELLHIGQSHVGPCSWSWRYDVASKHCTCRQDIDRQGRSIRSVDRGHFSDNTVAVATMSVSRDLLSTTMPLAQDSALRTKKTHCH